MLRPQLKQLCFCLCFLTLSITGMAWGLLGHRIVGEIAEQYLTSRAKIAIRKILGSESLAMSSNWADFIKSDSTYDYLEAWHYADFTKGLDRTRFMNELKADTAVDAYTRLNFLVKSLKDPATAQEMKLMYLRLLIHIVGDIHQPLHVSRNGTRGGNDVKVNWFTTPSNLHRIWDNDLIDNQKLSYTEYAKAINSPGLAQFQTWQKQPMAEWFYESYTLSETLHDEITQPNARLGYEYNFKYLDTLNNQLLKGGVRLAGLLNQIFG